MQRSRNVHILSVFFKDKFFYVSCFSSVTFLLSYTRSAFGEKQKIFVVCNVFFLCQSSSTNINTRSLPLKGQIFVDTHISLKTPVLLLGKVQMLYSCENYFPLIGTVHTITCVNRYIYKKKLYGNKSPTSLLLSL